MTSDDRPTEQFSEQVTLMRDLAGYWVQSQSVVSAYITANVVDLHHVEDLVQEVAQVCAEKFSTFDRDRSFVSWALGIARNRLLKYYRSRARDRLVLSEPALERLEAALVRVEPEAEERRAAVRRCLQRIDGRRREVVELRYGTGARVVDIAAQLQMSPSSVSVMLHKVRAALFTCVSRELANTRA
ncbi:MAG TPA: sigma-70 family RNA polymerase sigma factor [Lacipirellulaceae bacterium]|nr:sigma-70 family RNA polymerase sigma factor [Lacipirellulaceae bacterium]